MINIKLFVPFLLVPWDFILVCLFCLSSYAFVIM